VSWSNTTLPTFLSLTQSSLCKVHSWKFKYTARCLNSLTQHIFSVRTLSYYSLLDLDMRIGETAVPSHLRMPIDEDEERTQDPSLACQQFGICCERESNLIYLHRSYFAACIREFSSPPSPPSTPPAGGGNVNVTAAAAIEKHRYWQSVLAVYRSSMKLLAGIHSLHASHPRLCSQHWWFWSGAFSALVCLGNLVVGAPGLEKVNCSATRALRELDRGCALYIQGSAPCRPASTLVSFPFPFLRYGSGSNVFGG
jgi:hypothetical protein